jgi:hypothetical protein
LAVKRFREDMGPDLRIVQGGVYKRLVECQATPHIRDQFARCKKLSDIPIIGAGSPRSRVRISKSYSNNMLVVSALYAILAFCSRGDDGRQRFRRRVGLDSQSCPLGYHIEDWYRALCAFTMYAYDRSQKELIKARANILAERVFMADLAGTQQGSKPAAQDNNGCLGSQPAARQPQRRLPSEGNAAADVLAGPPNPNPPHDPTRVRKRAVSDCDDAPRKLASSRGANRASAEKTTAAYLEDLLRLLDVPTTLDTETYTEEDRDRVDAALRGDLGAIIQNLFVRAFKGSG